MLGNDKSNKIYFDRSLESVAGVESSSRKLTVTVGGVIQLKVREVKLPIVSYLSFQNIMAICCDGLKNYVK